jgi:hypothetical protein
MNEEKESWTHWKEKEETTFRGKGGERKKQKRRKKLVRSLKKTRGK